MPSVRKGSPKLAVMTARYEVLYSLPCMIMQRSFNNLCCLDVISNSLDREVGSRSADLKIEYRDQIADVETLENSNMEQKKKYDSNPAVVLPGSFYYTKVTTC